MLSDISLFIRKNPCSVVQGIRLKAFEFVRVSAFKITKTERRHGGALPDTAVACCAMVGAVGGPTHALA